MTEVSLHELLQNVQGVLALSLEPTPPTPVAHRIGVAPQDLQGSHIVSLLFSSKLVDGEYLSIIERRMTAPGRIMGKPSVKAFVEEACGKSCRRYAQKESRRQGKRGMGGAGTNSFLSLAGLQSCFPSLYFAGGRRTVRIFPVFPPPQKN